MVGANKELNHLHAKSADRETLKGTLKTELQEVHQCSEEKVLFEVTVGWIFSVV